MITLTCTNGQAYVGGDTARALKSIKTLPGAYKAPGTGRWQVALTIDQVADRIPQAEPYSPELMASVAQAQGWIDPDEYEDYLQWLRQDMGN